MQVKADSKLLQTDELLNAPVEHCRALCLGSKCSICEGTFCIQWYEFLVYACTAYEQLSRSILDVAVQYSTPSDSAVRNRPFSKHTQRCAFFRLRPRTASPCPRIAAQCARGLGAALPAEVRRAVDSLLPGPSQAAAAAPTPAPPEETTRPPA